MGTFLIFCGIAIAFSVFLYTINLLDSGKRKFSELKGETIISEKLNTDSTLTSNSSNSSGIKTIVKRNEVVQNLPDNLKDFIPTRRCPLCTRTLTRDEPLYATNVETGSGRKILIHGCPYCYKEEKKEKIS